jgi:hypothetical protein
VSFPCRVADAYREQKSYEDEGGHGFLSVYGRYLLQGRTRYRPIDSGDDEVCIDCNLVSKRDLRFSIQMVLRALGLFDYCLLNSLPS